jgi:hypothetical protein
LSLSNLVLNKKIEKMSKLSENKAFAAFSTFKNRYQKDKKVPYPQM